MMNLKLRRALGRGLLCAIFALAAGPPRSPAQTRKAPPPQIQPGCLTEQELTTHWPPQGAVAVKFANQVLKPAELPFDQVHVMNIACGDVRGNRPADFIVYSTKRDYGRVRILAVYDRNEKSLTNLGLVVDPTQAYENTNPDVLKVAHLRVESLTGDGHLQVVFTAGDAHCPSWISLWGWQSAAYVDLLTTTVHGCAEISDFAGDGKRQVIFWDIPPEFVGPEGDGTIAARVWPSAAFRWNGARFLRALVPPAYTRLTNYVEKNRARINGLENDTALMMALGQAYELQGKDAQALEAYAKAWDGKGSNCNDSDSHRTWSDQQLGEIEMNNLYREWSQQALPERFGEFAPQARSHSAFAAFAAGYARVESISQEGSAQVVKSDAESITAVIHLKVKELTEEGEIEKPYLATWQIRRDNCGFVSGGMKPE